MNKNSKIRICSIAILCALSFNSVLLGYTNFPDKLITSGIPTVQAKAKQISTVCSRNTDLDIIAQHNADDNQFTHQSIPAFIRYPTELKQQSFDSSKTLQNLDIRTSVTVEGQNGNSFSKIKVKNKEGYIDSDALTYDAQSIFTPVSPYVMYTKHNAVMYSSYCTDPVAVKIFQLNDEVIVQEDNFMNWIKVKSGNQIGYIPKDNLMKKKGQLPSISITQFLKPGQSIQLSNYTGQTYHSYSASPTFYNLNTDSDIDTFIAVVMAEGGGSYDGALATASAILNRCDTGRYFGGHDVLYMMGRNSAGIYWSASYHFGQYEKYTNGRYSAACKQAVLDALYGVRSHHFCDFATSGSSLAQSWKAQHPNSETWDFQGNMYCDGTM
jgi:hypothetical protein